MPGPTFIFAATVGLGVMEIEAADAEVAVAAIRAGETRVVGQEDAAAVFYREYGAVDILIVRKGVGKGRKV